MNFKILSLTEEIRKYSNYFTNNLKHYFNPTKYSRNIHSTFLYVNMDISGKYNVINTQVIYSTKVGYYLVKLQDKVNIRYAFGKYDMLNFQLARKESSPLQPLFIFDFSLNYKAEPYDAVFAKINKKVHILSKVYGLSDRNIEILNLKYKVYQIEDADYALIDFGHINKPKKFFKTLEEITDGLKFKFDESEVGLKINDFCLNSIAERDSSSNYNYCMVCGSKLEKTIHLALFDLSMRFPARCEACLEKIYSLGLYYDIYDEFSSSNTISHSELENKWDDLLDYNLKLLTENEFLEPFLEGLYKVRANENIVSVYSPLLKPIEEETEEIETLRICSVCGDYFYSGDQSSNSDICPNCLEKQDTEKKCKICGNPLDSTDALFDSDICSDCKEKRYCIELLYDLLQYVKPGSAFTKDSLIEKGLKHFELEVIIDNLSKYGLLVDDNENLLILETQHNLNEFIEMYSDNLPDDLIISDDDNYPKQTILSKYLNEDSLDKVFNLIDYQKYVESKQDNKTGDWLLIYKKDGNSISFMRFKTPFEAKMAAIRYLDEHNIISIVVEEKEDIFKSGNKILICPVCGKEFFTKSMFSQKYCDECNKYSHSEKSVLIGIHQGKYTNQTAIDIKNLLNQEFSKKDIAKKLKLENPSFINPILKYLLPLDYEVIDEPTNSEPSFEKSCPVCGKNFTSKGKFNTSQKYCDECNSKYDTFEKSALIGINEGIYTTDMAIQIKSLLDSGMSKSKIISKFKLKNTSMINPILKFLLQESEDFIGDELEVEGVFEDINKLKHCAVCGKTFIEPKNITNQKFCDDCKHKYDPFELRTLVAINEGLYDEDLAIEINDLLKQDYTKVAIGKKLNIDDSSINSILKFLLPKHIKPNKSKIKEDSKKVKICQVCGNEFIEAKQVSGQKYCENCKKKYSLSEISVLVGINNGEYTVETAKEIRKLQLAGFSNQKISYKLGISSPLVGPILKFIPVDDDELDDIKEYAHKIKNCLICDEEFIEPKNVSSQKYCQKCKDKYNTHEQNVLVGVKNGKYNDNTAIKIDKLKDQGKSNKSISKSLNIPVGIVTSLRDILLPNNNLKVTDGIFYNEEIGKYFVNIKNNDKTCVGLFTSEEEAISEKTKFLATNEVHMETDDQIKDSTGDGLNIEKIYDKWFVYEDNKLLDIFENEGDANNFCKFFNSLKKSSSNPNKQLYKREDKSNLNIVLKGVISDKDRLSLIMFISTFDCDINKISCDKLEDGFYNVLFDFDLEKYNINNAMINLNAMGWS